ncbi:hypothetical protein MOV76_29965 [Rhizobium sp. PRIMUS64]|nr:hypothetical protein [Rhizobium sp. PRIMUS64]MCJ9695818.1 hypothetical protein [Rhizobium sp. PRIMUS64]
MTKASHDILNGSKDDSIYVEIRDALLRMLLKSSPQWSLPDAERNASISQ